MNVNLTPINQNIPCLKNVTENEFHCVVNYFLRKSNKQTARELNLSPKSVETYLRRVNQKTGLSRDDLFLALWECGVFEKFFEKRAEDG